MIFYREESRRSIRKFRCIVLETKNFPGVPRERQRKTDEFFTFNCTFYQAILVVVAVLSVTRYYKNMNDVTGHASDRDRRKFAQN